MASNRKLTLPSSVSKAISANLAPAPVEPEPEKTETVTEETTEKPASSPHISFSQMSMYLRCSMQYFFRYVLGQKDRPKVSLALGKGGHAAIEKNTKVKIRTGEDAPVEAITDWASTFMDEHLRELPPSEIEKDVEPGSTKDKFIAATKVYRVRDAPAVIPLGAEVPFELDMNEFVDEPLPEPIRIVKGVIDLLYDDVGTKVATTQNVRMGVEDYKFVTRKRSQNEVNLSPQLTLYGTFVRKVTGLWPTRIGYRQMHPGTTKDGPDSILLQREAEHMTPSALNTRMKRLAFQFRQVENGIRNGVFVPTDDPITCSWCGFRERCQMSLVDDIQAATLRAQTNPR